MTWLIGGVVFLTGFYIGMVFMALMVVAKNPDERR